MFEEIIEAIRKGETVQTFDIDGKTYYSSQLYRPQRTDYPRAIEVESLSSIVDYIANKIDGTAEGIFIHVQSHSSVALMRYMDDDSYRAALVTASYRIVNTFRVNEFTGAELFVTALATSFLPSEQRDALAKFVSGLEVASSTMLEDDGVSQKTQVRVGITGRDRTSVPNPIKLQMFRTFPEVKQPTSEFALRLKKQDDRTPLVGLFQADNGLWQIDAMTNIKLYLQELLKGQGLKTPILA